MVKDTLFYHDKKYDGGIYQLFPNKFDTLFLAIFSGGLKDGILKRWYSPNELMEIRHFKEGKKDGEQTSFWENGNKRFEFTAKANKYEGTLREWDINGLLTHLANFKNGQEDGEQKMWNENGKIRSNYIIKDGRRFGLLGTKNCVNVTDSIINLR